MRIPSKALYGRSLLTIAAVATVASMVCSYSNAAVAGVAAAVDIEVVNQVKNYGMPILVNTLNNFDIGKIEFSEGNVDNIKIDLNC